MPEINQIDHYLQKLATTPEYQLFCQQYGAKYAHDIAKSCCYFDHNGKVQMIGYSLAIRNELSQAQIKNLVGLHTGMERVFKLAELIYEIPKIEDRIKSSKLISNAVEKIEYAIQKIWGFELDSKVSILEKEINANCKRLMDLGIIPPSFELIRLESNDEESGQLNNIKRSIKEFQNVVADPQLGSHYVASIKQMMEAIECRILILKEYQRDSMKELLDHERLLSSEIKTIQAGIEKVESVSLAKSSSSAKLNTQPSNLLPEVVEFQNFVSKYGHEGGWEPSNHQSFVKLARKYHGDKLYRICARKLPLVNYEEAQAHDSWFKDYEEKYKANKDAIQFWKNKPKDELIPKPEKTVKSEPAQIQEDREMKRFQVMLWRKAKNDEIRKQNERKLKANKEEEERKKTERQKQELKRQLLAKQKEELELIRQESKQELKPKPANLHLINMKQKLFQDQYLEKKAAYRLKKEEEEREKQARLAKLAEKVQVNVKHDPNRLFKPTASLLQKQNSTSSMENLLYLPAYGHGRAIPAWSKDINR
ncbi:hypothetical protein HDV01_006003 [Terramyces sp. JEL0728]|nr:hypothetical protein HDV01_006003 [Terramyces sp. JEL0728]